MSSRNKRLRSTSVSFGGSSFHSASLPPESPMTPNRITRRRRSSSPRSMATWRRADSVMEKINNPFLDRESPSHWRSYKPLPTLRPTEESPADADAIPSSSPSAATAHDTKLLTEDKAQAKYTKSLAFHGGLHSTYVADYPRGLRGLFVLIQSPLLLISIGIFAGTVGFAMDLWSVELGRYHRWLGNQQFGLFVMSALLAGGFSAVLTQCVCPQAAGSGLPFMRVAISGIDMSAYLSLRCVATKIVGLMAALGAGLSIGKEGPFIMISCGFASVLMNWRPFRRIRDDDTKRLEMLACACAAGVAATFGSPFGGVLFGVEVTSHFYLVRTLPRSFFAAIVGALLVDFGAANSRYGLFGNRNMGISSDTDAVNRSGGPTFIDLCAFAIMGIVCGLGGALFNYCLSILVRARDHFFLPSPGQSSRLRWWESLGKRLGLVLAVTLLSCYLEFYGDNAWFLRHGSPRRILDALFSQSKGAFDDGASQNTEEDSLLLSRSLVTFLPLKYVLTLTSIVLPVPAGLFTPTFVIGGIFGRMVGEAVRAFDLMTTNYEPFEFAIIGAGAFSSGVTHAVSTAVIIMEISHTDGLNLPVSVAILAAYFTAKRFTENVYDVLIVTSNLPRLKKLPKAAYDIPAWEVMKDVGDMGVLAADSTYEDALALLKRIDMEPVFPIVDSLESRFLLATVTRARLAYAVARCQRQGAIPIALARSPTMQPSSATGFTAAPTTSLLFPITPPSTTPTTPHPVGYDVINLRAATPVIHASYGATDTYNPRDDEGDDEEGDIEASPVHLLSSPIHFAFNRGGRVMDWGTNEICKATKLTVLINPSPFQLMEMTPMRRVDMLFRMLKLNNVFVARSGRLMGVISLERMMTFLGTTTPYQAPGLLRTLKNFCTKS
ncbi:Dipeptidyl peptidase 2 [Phytophthora boehmeriae]|uniref:Dipeptidyl peptidase 2 n=1 Tax=Phytophthora boehmeriae TaxID=109152 RepID=A0A8T1WYC6_9STRA|nr:Dipeptidyl peptidase 2 [Phytophthora boehmeriae]